MKEEYRPKTLDQKLGKLVEECGEVLAAVGKTQRWGLDSVNPELPPEEQETNRNWILRELQDLKESIDIVEDELSFKTKGEINRTSVQDAIKQLDKFAKTLEEKSDKEPVFDLTRIKNKNEELK